MIIKDRAKGSRDCPLQQPESAKNSSHTCVQGEELRDGVPSKVWLQGEASTVPLKKYSDPEGPGGKPTVPCPRVCLIWV